MAATSVMLIKILRQLLNGLLFNSVVMMTTYFVLCDSQNINLPPPVRQKGTILCISLYRLSAQQVFSRPGLLSAAAGAPPRCSPSPVAALPAASGLTPARSHSLQGRRSRVTLGDAFLLFVAGCAGLSRLCWAGWRLVLQEPRAGFLSREPGGEVLTMPWPQGGRELNQLP